MNQSPGRDWACVVGGLGLLLLWAAPEKFCPWLAVADSAGRAASESEPAEAPTPPAAPHPRPQNTLAAACWPDAIPPRWPTHASTRLDQASQVTTSASDLHDSPDTPPAVVAAPPWAPWTDARRPLRPTWALDACRLGIPWLSFGVCETGPPTV
ncbi:MAG TPA: hypothetical protein PKC49_11415 [Phycisphaerae bacterium]|nr:hypothetical protein [Phycisphaerae bacterium]